MGGSITVLHAISSELHGKKLHLFDTLQRLSLVLVLVGTVNLTTLLHPNENAKHPPKEVLAVTG